MNKVETNKYSTYRNTGDAPEQYCPTHNNTEHWKYVKGYEDRYLVSNLCRVWDMKNKAFVSQVLSGGVKYYYVNLSATPRHPKRKLKRVHTLVADAFLVNTFNKPFVDHIDRNRFNNSIYNLRWATRKENQRNLHNSVYVEWQGEKILLVELCDRLFPENNKKAYQMLYQKVEKGIDIITAVQEVKRYRKRGHNRNITTTVEGVEWNLYDWCVINKLDYITTTRRLKSGWSHADCIRGWRVGVTVYGVEYPTLEAALHSHNLSNSQWDRRKAQGMSLEEAIQYDPDNRFIHTVLDKDGNEVTGTRNELCKHFGMSRAGVDDRISKGMTLEVALTTPLIKRKYIEYFGVRKSRKYWLDVLGLKPRQVDRLTNRPKNHTLEEAFSILLGDTWKDVVLAHVNTLNV